MDLKEILAISGKPGLYKLLSQTKTGAIVESLLDQKRFPVFAHEKISSLEEISIFTETDDIALKDVFKKINEIREEKPAPDPKGNAQEIKDFFEEVVPDYDKERVYHSDIKKVLTWYNLLLGKNLLDFSEEEEENAESPSESPEEKAKNKAEEPKADEEDIPEDKKE